jgi:exodeoxyribonuclease-5
MQLTTQQQLATDIILSEIDDGAKEVSLSGAAGTGKTTLAKDLIANLVDQVYDVAIVAPTNKAAAVLNDKGLTATTIHAQFYIPVKEPGRPVKFVCTKDVPESQLPAGKITFAEIIAVDEASMIHSRVLADLKRMCNHLILIGDQHQLPPVNDKTIPLGYFNSLEHTFRLDEVLRQAKDSPILTLATDIRNGKPMDAGIRQFFPDQAFCDVAAEVPQFIAFTNKERTKINRLVRSRLGFNSAIPDVGEKMICASNYDDLLLNGVECQIVQFNWNGESRLARVHLQVSSGDKSYVREAAMCMYAFLKDLQPNQRTAYEKLMADWERSVKANPDLNAEDLVLRYGYCITAHAAQGSEYPSVVVIDQRSTLQYAGSQNGTRQEAEMFVRRWMYTAITRSKQQLIIAPEWWATGVSSGRAAA